MSKILIAFTSGIILGVLFAPASGKDTRAKLASLGNDCKNSWDDLVQTTDKTIDKIKSRVNKFKDSNEEDYDDLKYSSTSSFDQ